MTVAIPFKGGPRHGESTLSVMGLADEIAADGGTYHLMRVGPCRMPVYYDWKPSR